MASAGRGKDGRGDAKREPESHITNSSSDGPIVRLSDQHSIAEESLWRKAACLCVLARVTGGRVLLAILLCRFGRGPLRAVSVWRRRQRAATLALLATGTGPRHRTVTGSRRL